MFLLSAGMQPDILQRLVETTPSAAVVIVVALFLRYLHRMDERTNACMDRFSDSLNRLSEKL